MIKYSRVCTSLFLYKLYSNYAITEKDSCCESIYFKQTDVILKIADDSLLDAKMWKHFTLLFRRTLPTENITKKPEIEAIYSIELRCHRTQAEYSRALKLDQRSP